MRRRGALPDTANERKGCAAMFKKIVVALDGTPSAEAILPMVRALARARYAEVVLVRVSINYHESAPENVAARQYLSEVVREHGFDAGRVTTVLRYGDIAEEVLAAAHEANADLIALATHGRQGLSRAWLGSVSEHVLSDSPVPVLLLRADAHAPVSVKKVLVPVDNSPGSAAALSVASDLSVMTNAHVTLLQVVAPLPRWGTGEGIAPDWEEEVRGAAQAFLTRLTERLYAHGVVASGQAAIGPIAETISRVAREGEVDLIVMGTHALTGPRRALLGSVADAVMRTASVPVLLIRQDDDQPTGNQLSLADERATP
jgi:nucleotide-binding universal stress UspA family protein